MQDNKATLAALTGYSNLTVIKMAAVCHLGFFGI